MVVRVTTGLDDPEDDEADEEAFGVRFGIAAGVNVDDEGDGVGVVVAVVAAAIDSARGSAFAVFLVERDTSRADMSDGTRTGEAEPGAGVAAQQDRTTASPAS